METNALLDAVKSRLQLPSERALARKLQVEITSLRDMRRRGLSDERALQIATLLDLDPAEVIASVHEERAKDPDVKAVWKRISESMRSALAIAAMAAIVLSLAIPPRIAQAVEIGIADAANQLWIIRHRGRQRSWLLRALARFGRWALAPLAASFLALAPPAFAADPWSNADVTREAVYGAFHLADWGQTRTIARHPDQYRETNPFLGNHPSVHQVDRYFLATGVLHVAVAHWLPRRARSAFQYVTIGIEAGQVFHNYHLGMRLDF